LSIFKTIKSPVENILLKEKGSKFIGFAFPANRDDDVKNYIEKIKTEHPKATHHCYAFRLGLNGENHRSNDDGEPSGSAGLPIYNQILAHEITNVLVIVVRYFGGTKLGVGGLVKMYKESAKTTLDQAEIITKELENILEISFKFNQQNHIFTLLNKFDAKILNFNSGEICNITALVRTSQKENISLHLKERDISFIFDLKIYY
jgi:uncharacterized YigZ family protein